MTGLFRESECLTMPVSVIGNYDWVAGTLFDDN